MVMLISFSMVEVWNGRFGIDGGSRVSSLARHNGGACGFKQGAICRQATRANRMQGDERRCRSRPRHAREMLDQRPTLTKLLVEPGLRLPIDAAGVWSRLAKTSFYFPTDLYHSTLSLPGS